MLIRILTIVAIGLIFSCGAPQSDRESGKEIFNISISNVEPDSFIDFGIDIDIFNVDSTVRLVDAGGNEIPYQLEDRNHNGTPDKIFALVDVMPSSTLEITALSGGNAGRPPARVQVFNTIDGSPSITHTYTGNESWTYDGIVMENDWIAYRALMQSPFAFDIIAKRQHPLVVSTVDGSVTSGSQWGGDVLDEGNTLGFGSPALYDYSDVIPLNSFDSKEIEVLSEGPLRTEVKITTRGVPVRGEKIDVAVRWILEAGKHWAQVHVEILTVTNLSLQVAFGMPRHPDASDFTQGKTGEVHFAYTHGLQSSEGEQLGMGLLVPGVFELDHYREDPSSFYYLATPINQKVQYRMLAAWVHGPNTIFDEVDFLGLVKDYARAYDLPPTVKVSFQQ